MEYNVPLGVKNNVVIVYCTTDDKSINRLLERKKNG